MQIDSNSIEASSAPTAPMARITLPLDSKVKQASTTERPLASRWQRLLLGLILLWSAALELFRLDQVGYGNGYYAVGVKSMLTSWQHFFFVSFDPAGFVTVDKPPLGFWIEAISAKIFGFNGLSLLLPEALAAMVCVALLYSLVARHFGVWAGLFAAMGLAVTPVSVLTGRNNTIDMLLVLTTLLATWMLMRAVETGRLRWLLLCALLVGVGFNIKMLEAYLVLPAFGLMYLLGAPQRFWVRVGRLGLALLVLVSISLAWVTAVDLVPAAQRPYVGSSPDNSELTLAVGYNGLSRFLGRGSGPASPAKSEPEPRPASSRPAVVARTPSVAPNGEAGQPGFLRLLNGRMGPQVSWLLPLALFGMLALVWQPRLWWPIARTQLALVLWGVWLLTMAYFFSFAIFFHVYYMVMLIPAICALAGAGLVVMWRDYRRSGWRGWSLPIALPLTAVAQAILNFKVAHQLVWLAAPALLGSCLVALILVIARLIQSSQKGAALPKPGAAAWHRSGKFVRSAALLGMLSLLITPLLWSGLLVTLLPGLTSPALSLKGSPFPSRLPRLGPPQLDASRLFYVGLAGYLEEHREGATYLAATVNTGWAIPLMLASNDAVMAMGGFSGGDPILTTTELAQLVQRGVIKRFLLPRQQFNTASRLHRLSQHELRGVNGANAGLALWVYHHCSLVPSREWMPHLPAGVHVTIAGQLLDCSSNTTG